MARPERKPSVVIVQRIVPHYRVPFFNLLDISNRDLEIRVYHGGDLGGQRQHTFSSRRYGNHTLHVLGFSLVVQPKLMLDVLIESPDVVVLEGGFGILTNLALLFIRRLRHKPTLYWTAGWNNPSVRGIRSNLKSGLIRFCLQLCSGAIAYGSAAAGYLRTFGCSADKILIAQNAIDAESLVRDRPRWLERGKTIRQHFAPTAENVIIYVGQLAPLKRVEVLLEAFSRLHGAMKRSALIIVGEGSQRSALQRAVKDGGIPDVHFAGEVVESVEAYFAAGDLFVLPGTGGLALNQAMGLGLPVVATIADGTQNDLVIPGVNGYIVPADDSQALEKAMAQILACPEARKEMGDRSIQIVEEKASLRNMVEQYSAAIRRYGLGRFAYERSEDGTFS